MQTLSQTTRRPRFKIGVLKGLRVCEELLSWNTVGSGEPESSVVSKAWDQCE